jgi:phosphate starvation-inducible PhoH-like protein
MAVKALKEKQVKRIILTRPAVSRGKPRISSGDERKTRSHAALYDALRDMLPNEKLEDYILKGIIQIAPLAFMRGRTRSCFCNFRRVNTFSNENVPDPHG